MTNQKKFETEGYSFSIVAKHMEVTDAIRDYVFEKVGKIERFADHILDVVVNLDIVKLEHMVSINIKFLHFRINAHASTKDIYSAIDKASERLIRLIGKYKNKLQEHKGEHLGMFDLHVNVLKHNDLQEINDEIEEENVKSEIDRYQFHKVVATEKLSTKMLTQDEAIMKLELSDDHFLIFKSEEDQKIKVLYKREDENLSLVEIE
jgi:putative sigma-54 modulation protein